MKKAVDQSEKMVRTSVTIPESMKEEMEKVDVNWSRVIRESKDRPAYRFVVARDRFKFSFKFLAKSKTKANILQK